MQIFKYSSLKLLIACTTIVLLFTGISSCKKYLELKTDKKLVQPTTLRDAQALLDYYTFMNAGYPALGAISDDDYYLEDNDYNKLPVQLQKLYTWDKNAVVSNDDWNVPYTNVLYANMALETTLKVPVEKTNESEWKRIKGSALFFRAYNFFWAAVYWTVPYDPSTADQMPGIPLRLTSDVNERLSRGTVASTYQQILKDLLEAVPLLPDTIAPASRPSKAAAYGELARVYMMMRNYSKAGAYADSCLQLKNQLLDYNNVNASTSTPFRNFNPEVVFHSETFQNGAIYSPTAKTDTLLYQSYDDKDLRKSIFFKQNGNGSHSFKGSYAGSNYYDVPFCGIATDEMFLLRAECSARANDLEHALSDLNLLLSKRWLTGEFEPIADVSNTEILKLVLKERRKELVGRGLRWLDLIRMNQEENLQKSLLRLENGQSFGMPPGDTRYTFYIPAVVVDQNVWDQNQR